jgi:hypothetical protein
MVLWLFFAMVEKMSLNLEQEYVAMRFVGIPVMFIGASWFIFSLCYAGIIKPGSRLKIIALILLPPILCYWPLLTDKYRYLIIVSKTFGENQDVWGVLFYINLAFTYIYTFLSVIVLNRKLIERYGKNGRRFWLLVAVLIPAAINILNHFKLIGYYGFDVLPISFFFFCIIISVYIFKYSFIEIVPIASYELFTSLNEAVFITDKKETLSKTIPQRQSISEHCSISMRAAASRTFINISAALQRISMFSANSPFAPNTWRILALRKR